MNYEQFIRRARLLDLDESKIPSGLRQFIPQTRLWGQTDDLYREELVRLAPQVALEDLKRIVDQIDDELDIWLSGPEADAAPSEEYLAFSSMRMAADFT